MQSVWPWLAVAGAGILHGLNPASGWVFAAAWGYSTCLHHKEKVQAMPSLQFCAGWHFR